MVEQTKHLYIEKNTEILGGEPIITGTRTPVRAIVELWRLGITPNDYIERNRIPEELISLR